ncbi:VOC family protein [Stratiformator vulcanicus]|uniref:Glyoxalase-like domain protein n=1 Tax=Stratiformator vulcanicus TaxID=2527980 RepID=A0A517QZL5_9PLAN|nr:VOC family protein [Stratiformator vulcanicus]QDT37044.1 Glyoxalase-like domain protein [Stratiformator vulcanicus]
MQLRELAFFTDDVPALAKWWSTILGQSPDYSSDGITTFDLSGVTILIHKTYVPEDGDPPCEDHVAFSVDDIDTSVALLAENGIESVVPPRDYPWGRSAYLRDTAQHLIELQQSDE